MQMVLAKALHDFLSQADKGGAEQVEVAGIDVEGMFVADGLGGFLNADFRVEPAASILPLRLACEGQAPLAKSLCQEAFVKGGEVADAFDADVRELLFGNLAHAGDSIDFERGEPVGLCAGEDPKHAVALSLIGADLGDQAAVGDADRTGELGLLAHSFVQTVGGLEGRAVRLLGVHVSHLTDQEPQPNLLSGDDDRKWRAALKATDRLKDKYGEGTLHLGGALKGVYKDRVHEAAPKPSKSADVPKFKG